MRDIDQPTVIDALAEDANATSTPTKTMPADAPALWPYLRLPFRKRAEFFRQYKKLQEKQSELAELDKQNKKRRKNVDDAGFMLEQASMLYDLYGLMDDMMKTATVDATAYQEWVDTHSDEEFSQLFQAYVERSQPGEASSSAS